MIIPNFPRYNDQPIEFKTMEDSCGLAAIWGVLSHFKKPIELEEIIKRSHYKPVDGVLPAAMALTFHHYGLNVEQYADDDPESSELEKSLLAKASALGIGVRPSIDLEDLLSKISATSIPVVLYRMPRNGKPHLSQIIGTTDSGRLVLPNNHPEDTRLTKRDFLKGWNGERICRACVIAKA